MGLFNFARKLFGFGKSNAEPVSDNPYLDPTAKSDKVNFRFCENQSNEQISPAAFTAEQVQLFKDFEQFLEQKSDAQIAKLALQGYAKTLTPVQAGTAQTNAEQQTQGETHRAYLKAVAELAAQFGNFTKERTCAHLSKRQQTILFDNYYLLDLLSLLKRKYHLSLSEPDGKMNQGAFFILAMFLRDLYRNNHGQGWNEFYLTQDVQSWFNQYKKALTGLVDTENDFPFIEALKDAAKGQFVAYNDVVAADIQASQELTSEQVRDRFLFQLLAEVCKKATFLPLSFHELYDELVGDAFTPPQHEEAKNTRRAIINHSYNVIDPLLVAYLIRKLVELDLYDTLGNPQKIDQLNADLQKLIHLLFGVLLLVRRRNNGDVLLHQKDLELIKRVSFGFGYDFNELDFYCWLKWAKLI